MALWPMAYGPIAYEHMCPGPMPYAFCHMPYALCVAHLT